ncbi:MAG: hypothetical protein LBK42_08045 [Propionibacteriaceae bacterium]|jgi:hypothetical protein|nr:hypothetical protein [Propionibacteriaceae bacterium]
MKVTRFVLPFLSLGLCAVLTGCGSAQPAADQPTDDTTSPSASPTSDSQEVAAPAARLAYTYDGGIVVLDANTLEQVADLPLSGFNRVNAAGDAGTVLVSTEGGFRVLETGAFAQGHGDHYHYYAATPVLTDVIYPATTPGHVVVHDGQTLLFDDGTGQVTVFDSDDIAAGGQPVRQYTTPAPHHGVAVPLEDQLAVTEGTAESRSGLRLLDANDQVVAESDECPNIHGEAVAANEAAVFGCADGALVLSDGKITKVTSPQADGRLSTLSGTEASPIVLGNYTTADAAFTAVALIDTVNLKITLVDLPGDATYSSHSLARGDDGSALVLATDGSLYVIDPVTATITASYQLIDAWTPPADWQQPRPSLALLDGMAYITDTAHSQLLTVYPVTGQVWKTTALTHVPNEIAVVTGGPASDGHSHDDEDEHEESDEPTD